MQNNLAAAASPEFATTPEQEAIRLATKASSDSLMIPALAGTGKTTTLTLLAKEIRVPGLALAFNVLIKKELERRFPPNFKVMTMNGLGMQALGRALGPTYKFQPIDDKKLGKITTEVAKEWKVELVDDEWDVLRTLAQRAMQNGLVPASRDEGEGLLPDEASAWEPWLDDLLVPSERQSLFIELAREIITRDIDLGLQAGIISFQDQIYLSVCLRGKFPRFPVLLVDEAQDLDPLQHRMLEKSVAADGRLIICGDPKQAIYGFRGADHESMDKIRRLRSRWTTLPLTVTFRCPKAVVERQLDHAPHYKAAPEAPAGAFVRLPLPSENPEEVDGPPSWSFEDFKSLLPRGASLAILCRNNAPLLSLAFKLLRKRVPVSMLGRDIGKGLTALAKRICPDDDEPLAKFLASLDEWETTETSLALVNGKEEKVAGIRDKVECLRAVAAGTAPKTAGGLRREITALFAREDGAVVLSSIHKSKGLEWDGVMLLDPWRIPSKFAKQAAANGDGRALVQEYNLRYVAETRTKSVLCHASMSDYEGAFE